MYSIKYISTATGIGVHTLRAWERRYSLIRPSRNDKGRRTYSESDLDLLKIVSELVHLGEPIGLLSKLDREQIQDKWETLQELKLLKGTKYERFSYSIIVLKTAIEVGNKEVIVHELTTLQSELSLKNFTVQNLIEDFVIPTHAHLSKFDYNNEINGPIIRLTYLLLSQLLRQALAQCLDKYVGMENDHPILIGSTGSIRGEIDGLICTVRSYLQGKEAIFIGNRLSQQVIMELVSRLGAEKVIITDRQSPFKEKLNLCEVFDHLEGPSIKDVQWAVLLNDQQSPQWPCCVPHVANLKTYTSFQSLDQFLEVS